MTLSIEIDGELYVPLVAVPYVTGGLFGVSVVAKMISDPESYCDANHSTILSAYQVVAGGRLVPLLYSTFQSLAGLGLNGLSLAPEGAIAGVVVPEVSLHCLYRTVSGELGDAGRLDRTRDGPYWDLEAELPVGIHQRSPKVFWNRCGKQRRA
ncbi:MAG: hypothetical protein IPI40_03370 [Betaproteobacteria bacterium]|nr:hypothetical protein [Betaproteobacteria bacterium]